MSCFVLLLACRLVKRAMHGTRMMSWQNIRDQYGREVVNLRNEGRWVFLNTLFSVSEAVMYMQLVDRLDQGAFSSASGQMTYQGLYRLVSKALYRTHVEGKLKGEIIQVRGLCSAPVGFFRSHFVCWALLTTICVIYSGAEFDLYCGDFQSVSQEKTAAMLQLCKITTLTYVKYIAVQTKCIMPC